MKHLDEHHVLLALIVTLFGVLYGLKQFECWAWQSRYHAKVAEYRQAREDLRRMTVARTELNNRMPPRDVVERYWQALAGMTARAE